MQRKEPHIIHFQEFENLERDCQRLLGSGDFDMSFNKLDNYLHRHGSNSSKQDFVMLKAEYSELRKEVIKGIESTEELNTRRRKLNHRLLEFISSLKPDGYLNYEEGSLRRKSKWDERENLTIYLQFDSDFQNINYLFETLTVNNKWQPLIPKVRYFINDIEEGHWVLAPDDFDYENATEEEKLKISSEKLLKDSTAVILRDIIIEEEITEHGKIETNQKNAEAIVEKDEKRFQIWISAVGEPSIKHALVNNLLEWFENHELFANGKAERFTICIPHAVGFRAVESTEGKVFIQLKQPI